MNVSSHTVTSQAVTYCPAKWISDTSLWFWLLLFFAVLLRAYLVLLDINILLDKGLIQDDAFYYYEIANYILATGQSSFDGINLTNGFHPVWQAISLPIFSVWQGEAPLRIMLALAALLDLASLWIIYWLVRSLVHNEWAAWCTALIWAFHGTIIRTWFNGLETALHIFTLLIFLVQYLKINQQQVHDLKQHVLLGIFAGLAFLARTDSALIVFVMFAFLYLPPLFDRASAAKAFSQGAAASAACLLLISPWLIWNLVQFGSIVQVSGQVKYGAWLVGGAPPEQPLWQEIILGAWSSLVPIRIVFEKMFALLVYKLPISGYFYLLGFILLMGWTYLRNHVFKQALLCLWPFFLGALVLFLYHAGVRHFVRGWYNAPLLLVFTISMGLMLSIVFTRLNKQRSIVVCMALMVILLLGYSPYSYTKPPKKSRIDPRVLAAQWLNQHAESGSLAGAANAGIVGYYATQPVINLDGVVNQHAFQARMTDTIHQYVNTSGIQYLADHKGAMNHLCADNSYYECVQRARWHGNTLLMEVVRSPAEQ